ncbi:MAG: 2-amino-4-ketopentanoate thiolase [Clostridiales bacterium]|nr:2-amino-4-ketopentanoate thiolase [Clostridiales bacterium]
MAKKGDWVRIHRVVLEADERAPGLPEDTASVPLEMWVKGTLLADAEIGDQVEIETATNRIEYGRLIEVNPYYTHDYGKFVPELIQIDHQLRALMAEDGGDK